MRSETDQDTQGRLANAPPQTAQLATLQAAMNHSPAVQRLTALKTRLNPDITPALIPLTVPTTPPAQRVLEEDPDYADQIKIYDVTEEEEEERIKHVFYVETLEDGQVSYATESPSVSSVKKSKRKKAKGTKLKAFKKDDKLGTIAAEYAFDISKKSKAILTKVSALNEALELEEESGLAIPDDDVELVISSIKTMRDGAKKWEIEQEPLLNPEIDLPFGTTFVKAAMSKVFAEYEIEDYGDVDPLNGWAESTFGSMDEFSLAVMENLVGTGGEWTGGSGSGESSSKTPDWKTSKTKTHKTNLVKAMAEMEVGRDETKVHKYLLSESQLAHKMPKTRLKDLWAESGKASKGGKLRSLFSSEKELLNWPPNLELAVKPGDEIDTAGERFDPNVSESGSRTPRSEELYEIDQQVQKGEIDWDDAIKRLKKVQKSQTELLESQEVGYSEGLTLPRLDQWTPGEDESEGKFGRRRDKDFV